MSYHDHKHLQNQTQKEALLNEYKGNLFEYLVAKELAQFLNNEAFFMRHLSRDLLDRLRIYQETLLNYDGDLYQKLPVLAHEFFKNLVSSWSTEKVQFYRSCDELFLLGKLEANSGERLWSEADLLLRSSLDKHLEIPISLKLSKKGSFTNTKSAGIMSFLTTYFSNYSDLLKTNNLSSIEVRQERFNLVIDNSFDQMCLLMHQEKGLKFSGGFENSWPLHFPDLPGDLTGADHQILMDHYKRLSLALLAELEELYEINQNLFLKSAFVLMGFGELRIHSWTCFHHDHVFFKAHELDRSQLEDVREIVFLENESYGSINLKIHKFILQLRIKPMNKFTTKAYKVNCSVRWH